MNLETRILDAIERGDTHEVERLRSEYRRTVGVIRPGGSCFVSPRQVERSRPASPRVVLYQRKPRPAPLPVPELRVDATPTVSVRLGYGALKGVCAELERGRGLLDVVETGGNLFGRRQHNHIEVIDVTGPGEDGKARRFEDSVRISIKDAHVRAQELERIHGGSVYFVGGWHTHPRPVREPSETDRAQALDALDHEGSLRWSRFWLDLILTPHREAGWDEPKVYGWATRHSDRGPVTEPVLVVE